MYWITRLDDGRFLCEYRIQDGTEEFIETDPDRAVSRLIEAGKFMNGTAPTYGDIRWYQEEEYTTSGVRRVPIAGPPVTSSPAVGPCPADDVGEAKAAEPAWKTRLKAIIDRL